MTSNDVNIIKNLKEQLNVVKKYIFIKQRIANTLKISFDDVQIKPTIYGVYAIVENSKLPSEYKNELKDGLKIKIDLKKENMNEQNPNDGINFKNYVPQIRKVGLNHMAIPLVTYN